MKRDRLLVFLCFWGLILAVAACGKKGPPFVPQKQISLIVTDLRGELQRGDILLKGSISGPKDSEDTGGLIKGARVYYGRYPLESPPCEECPIEYHGFNTYGPEVITGEGFRCKVSTQNKEGVYFLKVNLIGPDEAIGPPSNRIKVIVKI